VAAVDLGLADPAPQRLAADAELARHPGDHAEALAGLLDRLQHHAHRPSTKLGRVPPLGWVGSPVICHDSILPSKRWSLQETQGESDLEATVGPRPVKWCNGKFAWFSLAAVRRRLR